MKTLSSQGASDLINLTLLRKKLLELRLTKASLVLVGCLSLALVVRVWGLDFGLPHRYHVDEPGWVLAALQVGQGNFNITYPPGSPNLHQLVFLGMYLFLFIWYFITGQITSTAGFAHQYQLDPTLFYLLGRILSVIHSMLALIVLYRLARKLRDRTTALAACLFLALSFLEVREAHFLKPYPLLALLSLVVIYLTLLHVQTKRRWYIIWAGVFCGIAIGLRYSMLPLGLILAAGILFYVGNQWRRITLYLTSCCIVGASVLIGYAVGLPALFLNPASVFTQFSMQTSAALTTEGFWGFEFTDLSSWEFYGMMLELNFGLPLVLMLIIGLVLALWRRDKTDVILLAFPVGYAVVLLSVSAQSSAFARYLVPIIPILAFYAADATTITVRQLTQRWSVKATSLGVAVVSLALVIIPAQRIILLDQLWSQTDTRTIAKAWIESNIPAGAKIATQWHTPPLATAEDPEANSKRVYDVTEISPFSTKRSLYHLNYYQEQKFRYIILSNFVYDIPRVDPQENMLRESFYKSLDEQAELLAEFAPYSGQKPAFFFEQMWGPITDLALFDRPGPTIKIYKLEAQQVAR